MSTVVSMYSNEQFGNISCAACLSVCTFMIYPRAVLIYGVPLVVVGVFSELPCMTNMQVLLLRSKFIDH